jgi:hypothetical protein
VRGPRALLVTANHAGLRQCFLEGGRLRFARLERTVEMVPQALAAFARSETLRLTQYLTTLRALPRESGPLPALVVAPPGERAAFEQALVSDARVTFQTIDATQALAAVKLRHLPHGTGAEALYLHLAARNAPREQFASSGDRRRYVVWKLQRAVVAAGALGFAACMLYAGTRWYEAYDLHARAEEQVREGRNAAERYQRITAAFPVTETTTENLRAAVLEFRRIADASAQPETAFIHVSRVLERFPQVELDAVNWRAGRPGEVREGESRGGASAKARERHATQRLPRHHRAGTGARHRARERALRARAHPAALRRHFRRHADGRHRRPRRRGRGAALHHHPFASAAMTLTPEELRKLALPALAALVLVAVGGVLASNARDAAAKASRELSAAQAERRQNADRLARIAEEEREVKEKLDVYQQLKRLHILGEERRLEWADAVTRIRNQRELLDLTYRVDRQKLLKSVPGKPANVEFFASTMTVQLDLLHEEDLLRFLADLRASGNAYYAVRSCGVRRTGQAATGTTITPRLRANCEIDLITVVDGAAKR